MLVHKRAQPPQYVYLMYFQGVQPSQALQWPFNLFRVTVFLFLGMLHLLRVTVSLFLGMLNFLHVTVFLFFGMLNLLRVIVFLFLGMLNLSRVTVVSLLGYVASLARHSFSLLFCFSKCWS